MLFVMRCLRQLHEYNSPDFVAPRDLKNTPDVNGQYSSNEKEADCTNNYVPYKQCRLLETPGATILQGPDMACIAAVIQIVHTS